MSKEELIQFEGLVIEILPDARYRVHLDAAARSWPTRQARWRRTGSRLWLAIVWPSKCRPTTSEGPPYLPS